MRTVRTLSTERTLHTERHKAECRKRLKAWSLPVCRDAPGQIEFLIYICSEKGAAGKSSIYIGELNFNFIDAAYATSGMSPFI